MRAKCLDALSPLKTKFLSLKSPLLFFDKFDLACPANTQQKAIDSLAFSADKRTKEIGVRKVLGARLPQIVWLLTGQFVKWVIIANLIAWSVGYWVMNPWLEGFAFRTGLSAAIYLVSGLSALGIPVVTVISQVVKAALANPVDSLRYE